MKDEINFTRIDEPNFEKIFEVQTTVSDNVKVCAFEPELRGDAIVLPLEFTKADGERVTLGFTLDKAHLRDLFDALDYPDTDSAIISEMANRPVSAGTSWMPSHR